MEVEGVVQERQEPVTPAQRRAKWRAAQEFAYMARRAVVREVLRVMDDSEIHLQITLTRAQAHKLVGNGDGRGKRVRELYPLQVGNPAGELIDVSNLPVPWNIRASASKAIQDTIEQHLTPAARRFLQGKLDELAAIEVREAAEGELNAHVVEGEVQEQLTGSGRVQPQQPAEGEGRDGGSVLGDGESDQ